ncbi:Y-family DNA polymerase [Halosquirtibacter xylanolyticus]|nr:Y-family DNA polymerase [Prolixibacteraceae bacterium]
MSCERLFDPSLDGKPVAVLSNNDGCIVARSNEVKKLGVPMGAPVFKYRDLVEKNKVHLFSSNYVLYGDISDRVMKIISSELPLVELYSIDEAFVGFEGISEERIAQLCEHIRTKILKWVGIPVSIGVGRTKTLAKVASNIAKKFDQLNGVHILKNDLLEEKALKWTSLDDIWGIGRQLSKRFNYLGVSTAYDFIQLSDYVVRKTGSIQSLRSKHELLGSSCFMLENQPPKRKSISSTRTFYHMVTDKEELTSRIANFSVRCAEKLRNEGICAYEVKVFIATNRNRTDLPQYYRSGFYRFISATHDTMLLSSTVSQLIDEIFVEGYHYKKAGVIVSDFIDKNILQMDLFTGNRMVKYDDLFTAWDHLSKTLGKETIRLGRQYKGDSSNEKRSPRYTTRWNDLLIIGDPS